MCFCYISIKTSSSVLLSSKKTNIYNINELSNVCFDNGKLIFFNPNEQEKAKLLSIANLSGMDFIWECKCLGFTSQVKEDVSFTKEVVNMEEFKKYPVGLFLATTSSEDFQSYRLYNSILFLHRNGVDLSPVFYTCSFVSM